MATASPPDLGACTKLVSALTEARLLVNGHHAAVQAHLKAFPDCKPPDLAGHLVEKGILTQFQADAALQGKAKDLLLASYTLVDVLGAGSMGTVYRARSTQDESAYAIKVI